MRKAPHQFSILRHKQALRTSASGHSRHSRPAQKSRDVHSAPKADKRGRGWFVR